MTKKISERADGRDRGAVYPGPCPVCDAAIADGELCMTHRAMFERDVPAPLVKRIPPKEGCGERQLHWPLEFGLGPEAGEGQGAQAAAPVEEPEPLAPCHVLELPGEADVLGLGAGVGDVRLHDVRAADVDQHRGHEHRGGQAPGPTPPEAFF